MGLFRKRTPLLDAPAQLRIVSAIRLAEAATTGEIRIFVESHCSWVNATDRAIELFQALKMTETGQRNAVLVYLAVTDKQFALWGDEAIYLRSGGARFWEASASILQASMREGDIAGGLVRCIESLGAALAAAFPADPSVNRNELPDEIVFGK